jgi:hypothetical protein
MARIDDYNSYISGKTKNFSSENYFSAEMGYLDIVIKGNPPEMLDIDESKCEIEYEVTITRNRSGIDDLSFKILKIELEVEVDDYPNESKKFEFEIMPGINIDHSLVISEKLEKIIPTYPKRIQIDMRKSMDVKDFKVIVEFGND